MTKRLVDIDDDALERARRALGTSTMRETVARALQLAAATEADRRSDALDDLAGIEFADRQDAWR